MADLTMQDRALITAVVPAPLRIFFTGVRVSEATAALLAAARKEGTAAREASLEAAVRQALGILYPPCGTAAGAEHSLARAVDVLRAALMEETQ